MIISPSGFCLDLREGVFNKTSGFGSALRGDFSSSGAEAR